MQDKIHALQSGAAVTRRTFLGRGGMVFGLAATGYSQESREQTIAIKVVEAPNGATLALVPVYINDQGPYTFALDTGASQSLVDKPIVELLKLQVTGKAEHATGVACTTELVLVEVKKWRVGHVELPAATITSLRLPEPNWKHGLQGLLGSDILSRYGSFTLDYRSQKLTLR